MTELKKIATRESYGKALTELGAEHDDLIVFDADLSGATKTGIFKKAFPDRHINCGIAEANMVAAAAGASQPAKTWRTCGRTNCGPWASAAAGLFI